MSLFEQLVSDTMRSPRRSRYVTLADVYESWELHLNRGVTVHLSLHGSSATWSLPPMGKKSNPMAMVSRKHDVKAENLGKFADNLPNCVQLG